MCKAPPEPIWNISYVCQQLVHHLDPVNQQKVLFMKPVTYKK